LTRPRDRFFRKSLTSLFKHLLRNTTSSHSLTTRCRSACSLRTQCCSTMLRHEAACALQLCQARKCRAAVEFRRFSSSEDTMALMRVILTHVAMAALKRRSSQRFETIFRFVLRLLLACVRTLHSHSTLPFILSLTARRNVFKRARFRTVATQHSNTQEESLRWYHRVAILPWHLLARLSRATARSLSTPRTFKLLS
jgi:hypothetical protein